MRSTTLMFSVVLALSAGNAGADSATMAIRAPAADSWPSFGRDYSNQRLSPLQQIDASNVHRLVRAWTYRSGVKATFQATPIVVDRTMYLSLPHNHVVALDARTGQALWRYTHVPRPDRKPCCGPVRPIAVWRWPRVGSSWERSMDD